MKTVDLDQYKLLFASFNDEVSRFWSRFNILMGIQIGGFIGVLASLKTLVLNPCLFRLALILMMLYSDFIRDVYQFMRLTENRDGKDV